MDKDLAKEAIALADRIELESLQARRGRGKIRGPVKEIVDTLSERGYTLGTISRVVLEKTGVTLSREAISRYIKKSKNEGKSVPDRREDVDPPPKAAEGEGRIKTARRAADRLDELFEERTTRKKRY